MKNLFRNLKVVFMSLLLLLSPNILKSIAVILSLWLSCFLPGTVFLASHCIFSNMSPQMGRPKWWWILYIGSNVCCKYMFLNSSFCDYLCIKRRMFLRMRLFLNLYHQTTFWIFQISLSLHCTWLIDFVSYQYDTENTYIVKWHKTWNIKRNKYW